MGMQKKANVRAGFYSWLILRSTFKKSPLWVFKKHVCPPLDVLMFQGFSMNFRKVLLLVEEIR